ncbi:hypothetical protein Ciccas_004990 [Cichlidogyrus casuarinus]|uniref:Integrase zinc-binding domain-containing protein n=1 Tax=Cichlidogyrus casuarinus TaxID=1844966 RepID=A0ABD2QA11_9PLAT
MLADHESNMLAVAESRRHTPRSSLSTAPATFLPSEKTTNAGLPNLPPDKNTIMWVLSYLIATNVKRRKDLNEQTATFLMNDIEHSEAAISLLPQAQKRAASFNASPSEILRNLQQNADFLPPSHEETAVRDNRPLQLKINENKRVTVGACSKPTEFCFPQLERRSSINNTNLQAAGSSSIVGQGELACRILGVNEFNQNNLMSSGSSSSPRQYSSRTSSLSIKQKTKRSLGNQANDDLFATVSFEPQSNYAFSHKSEFPSNSRSRTSSDAIIYRRKINTLTHTILRHSLFNDQNKALSAVRELISKGDDLSIAEPDKRTMVSGNQGNPSKSKMKLPLTEVGSMSATNSTQDSICSDPIHSRAASETFDELLGPASMHYGLTTHSKRILNLPISSLYDDIVTEIVQDCSSCEQYQAASKIQTSTTR